MLLRQDELNVITGDLKQLNGDVNKAVEMLSDWLFLAYADGKTDVEEQLNGNVDTPVDHVMDVVSAVTAGKTAFERLVDYVYLEDIEALITLFSNERHRVYNTAGYDTAKSLNAEKKVWHCLKLPTSRDTHIYLDGMKKGIDDNFYTYNGDAAQHPGAFGIAEEDINCLCYLTYSK